jgi:hypothetical protein
MLQKFRYCVATLVLFTSSLLAQSGAGSIQGTIQDATGAAVPGAKVQVRNQKTGLAIETSSNTAGFYAAPGLFAGSYSVLFTASGMKKHQVTLVLENAQNAIVSPRLEIGDVTETVTVTEAENQLVTYDSGTVSTHLDRTRIDQLPQNGRNVLTLAAATTPGLEAGGQRANGLMGEALEYTQDGAPMTNRNFGGAGNSTQAQLPDPDSVQEVKIETLNSSAQFATPATAIITTKSGTNQFHGSMFETMRNNAVGIARARQNPPNFAAPHLIRNEFGASIGGPVQLPKVYNGLNRTFFFFGYERFSLRQASNQLVTVPTVAMRQGDFSGLINRAGIQQILYDPNTTGAGYSRQPFPGNRIPLMRISPLAKAIYEATPLPTNIENPLVGSNLTDVNNVIQNVPNINTRFDHVLNPYNRLYARFTHINQFQQSLRNFPNQSPANIAGGGLPAGATGYQQIPIRTISGAIGFSRVFSPTFFSETIVSQQWMRQYVQGGGDVNQNYEKILGLPNNFGQSGFPNIGANLITPYGGSQYNYGMSQRLFNFDQNMTRILGRHTLQFGGRYRHETFGYLPDRQSDTIAFSNLATAVYDPSTGANYAPRVNTGFPDADFFLGAASSYSQVRNAPFGDFYLKEYDLYFQDNWRIGKSLTLNLGLRWEGHPSPKTREGLALSFDLKNNALVLPRPVEFYIQNGLTTAATITNMRNLGVRFSTPQQAGLPESGIYDSYNNFGPRFGFAWTPFPSRWGTVVRGGYGGYFYPVPIRSSMRVPITNLPYLASYSRSFTAANQAPDGLPNFLLRSPLTVIAGANSDNSIVDTNTTTALLPGISVQTLDPNYPPARVQQSNLTIEQPVKGGSVLRVTYLYVYGSNLDQNYQYNFAPSNYVYMVRNGVIPPTGTLASVATRPYDRTTWGTNVMSTKYGWSNNGSLQINFQRPFRKGYAYQIFFVATRAFRVGGNTFRDSVLYPADVYAPGALPEGIDTGTILKPSRELNRAINYRVDTAIPVQRISFNGVVDVPVGRGKRFLRNANRWVDALVGGFQFAGIGNVVASAFAPAAGNWGPVSDIQVYKKSVPVTDCRSGVCREAFMWFNGYIAPPLINNATGGVTGLPANYQPYQTPINNTPGQPNYGSNNVQVRLNNGQQVTVAYNPGPSGAHPLWGTTIKGPFNYIADLSLYKVFTITERVKVRFNVDAFNALNIQGNILPNTLDGIQQLTTSFWTPRQVQFTARLSF